MLRERWIEASALGLRVRVNRGAALTLTLTLTLILTLTLTLILTLTLTYDYRPAGTGFSPTPCVDPGPTPVARRSPGSGGPNVEAAPRKRPLNSRARRLPAAVTRKILNWTRPLPALLPATPYKAA